jgi:uncharacterized Zn ribbon protein
MKDNDKPCKTPCPKCGEELTIKNGASNSVLCPSCKKEWFIARTLLMLEVTDEERRRGYLLRSLGVTRCL